MKPINYDEIIEKAEARRAALEAITPKLQAIYDLWDTLYAAARPINSVNADFEQLDSEAAALLAQSVGVSVSTLGCGLHYLANVMQMLDRPSKDLLEALKPNEEARRLCSAVHSDTAQGATIASESGTPPAPQQSAPKAAPGEPPGIQALMCVISSLHSLRDTAHFSDEEGELTNDLCTLRDWAYAQTAAFQPSPTPQADSVLEDAARYTIEDVRKARSEGYRNGIESSVPSKITKEMRHAFREKYKESSIWSDRLDIALGGMLAVAPQPAPAPLSDDTKRLDWLDRNIFSREMSEWDAKYGHGPDYNMWVVFSPKGVQGSARNIIDAAIAAQGGKRCGQTPSPAPRPSYQPPARKWSIALASSPEAAIK